MHYCTHRISCSPQANFPNSTTTFLNMSHPTPTQYDGVLTCAAGVLVRIC